MKYSNGTKMIEAIQYTSTQSAKDIAKMLGSLPIKLNGVLTVNGLPVDKCQFVVMVYPTGIPLVLNKIPDGYKPCEVQDLLF